MFGGECKTTSFTAVSPALHGWLCLITMAALDAKLWPQTTSNGHARTPGVYLRAYPVCRTTSSEAAGVLLLLVRDLQEGGLGCPFQAVRGLDGGLKQLCGADPVSFRIVWSMQGVWVMQH